MDLFDPPPLAARLPGETFLVLLRDGPNGQRLREEHLEAHLAHVEAHWRSYLAAGPLRPPEGGRICASALLVQAENLDQARDLIEQDPYVRFGVYERLEFHLMSVAIGQCLGGKIWNSPADLKGRSGA